MIGAGVGPGQIGPARWRVSVASLLRDAGSSYNSCGVKPAFVRSPPLLAPSTNVIVAKLSNNCFEPSAFLAKAQAVLACVRVDESDLVAKDAVSYDFLGVEARGAVLLGDLGRHRGKQLRGR